MIITGIYIENFGGISDRHFEFKDGLNIISMPNEGGKSTIAEFIRVMLFGVNSLRFNQRKKYMPFGMAVMGGEIYVDCGGTEYAIRRSFGNRRSDDNIEVRNRLNGSVEQKLCVDNVGEILLGINGDTYDNTCYIKQLSCAVNEEKTAEIQAKLINISQSGDEDYSYKKAIGILDSAVRELTGTKGKIRQVKDKLNELAVRKAKRQELEREIAACRSELKKTAGERKSTESPLPLIVSFAVMLCFAVLSFWIKPYFTLPFAALFAAMGIYFVLRRKKSSDALLENAKMTGYYESRLQSLSEEYKNIDVSEYEFYSSELERFNNALRDVEYAKKCLSEAFEELQKDYAPRLNKTALSIFSKITDGKYTDFQADDRYNITVRDANNRLISGEYLSGGTFDQIYFSLRMALAGLAAPDIPLVLDDSFALYDDLRLKNAVSYLDGRKGQTLLFSCHGREKDLV